MRSVRNTARNLGTKARIWQWLVKNTDISDCTSLFYVRAIISSRLPTDSCCRCWWLKKYQVKTTASSWAFARTDRPSLAMCGIVCCFLFSRLLV